MITGNRKYIVGERQHTKLPLVLAVLVLLVVAGATLIAWEVRHQPQPVPAAIAKQLSFSPFVVAKGSGATVVNQKYDPSSGVYFFIMQMANGQKVTVSEQASPVNFSEIPDLYTKLLDGLHRYDTLETINGTVTLAHPEQGQTAAILNDKGVLMFVRADDPSLNKQSWKRIIESLEIHKLPN